MSPDIITYDSDKDNILFAVCLSSNAAMDGRFAAAAFVQKHFCAKFLYPAASRTGNDSRADAVLIHVED